MCILSVYTMLKVVGYYDLSVLYMSVMGFQKSLDGVGGWGELYPIFLDVWNLFNFAKPLSRVSRASRVSSAHAVSHSTRMVLL